MKNNFSVEILAKLEPKPGKGEEVEAFRGVEGYNLGNPIRLRNGGAERIAFHPCFLSTVHSTSASRT